MQKTLAGGYKGGRVVSDAWKCVCAVLGVDRVRLKRGSAEARAKEAVKFLGVDKEDYLKVVREARSRGAVSDGEAAADAAGAKADALALVQLRIVKATYEGGRVYAGYFTFVYQVLSVNRKLLLHGNASQRVEENTKLSDVSIGEFLTLARKARHSEGVAPDSDSPDQVKADKYAVRRLRIVQCARDSCRQTHTKSAVWHARFQELKDYIAAHGTALLKQRERETCSTCDVSHGALCRWVHTQRARRAWLEAFYPARVRALNGLGAWRWSVFEDLWDEMFADLEAYIRKHGDSGVKQNIPKDERCALCGICHHVLGQWVRTQRRKGTRAANAKKKPHRIQALSNLRSWVWSVHDVAWNRKYEELEQRYAAGTRLPQELINWRNKQRASHQNEKLSQWRVDRLNLLPNWAWGCMRLQW